MANSQGFLLYPDQWCPIESLPMEKRGLLLTALYAYQGACEMPPMDPGTEMAFRFLRSRIDQNRRNREEQASRNRQNGQGGGRPKKTDDEEETHSEQKNPVGFEKPSGFSETHNNPVGASGFSETHPNPENPDGFSKPNLTQPNPKNPYNVMICNVEEKKDKDTPPYPPQGGSVSEEKPAQEFSLAPPGQEPARKPRSRKRPDLRADDFEALWEKFPRHRDKEGARQAWDRLAAAGELPDQLSLMAAVTWQASDWKERRTEESKIPHLSTWLNKRRWNDEQPKVQFKDRSWSPRASPGYRRLSPEERTYLENERAIAEAVASIEAHGHGEEPPEEEP